MTLPPTPPVLAYSPLGAQPLWRRWLMRPIGWPLSTACLLAMLASCFASSAPGGYMPLDILCFFLWLILAVVFLLRFLIRAILWSLSKTPTTPFWRQAWHWTIPPAVFILTLLLLNADVPLKLRFFASLGPMNRLAAHVATTPGPYPDHRVGLFYARHIEPLDGGVVFEVPGAGFMDAHGFAFFPPSSSATTTRSRWHFTHFHGNWYTAHDPF